MMREKKYHWDAEEYAKHSSAQQVWAKELIAKLQLKGSESILDIGCGDGKMTVEIAAQLPEGDVLGVDSSPDMIALARKKFPQSKYSNLSFKLADANHLPFAEQFDIVFSNAALHWIKDHGPVIPSIQNSLKPGGKLCLQMGGKGNAEAIISVLDTIISEKKWNRYFSDFEFPYGFYEPGAYVQLLKKANLAPVRVELLPKNMSYKDKDGLAGWVRTTWLPYTNQVPVHLRKVFISRLIEKYVEKFPLDNDGCVHVAMVRLEVEAEKTDNEKVS